MNKVKLGVNLDHVATVREARGTSYPDIVKAIQVAEGAGADGITIHLRQDRRHIQDRDVYAARGAITTRLNLEMAATDEMIGIALDVKPHFCCVVPEKREELTTEGGLDVVTGGTHIEDICRKLEENGIQVSLFIEPDRRAIDAAVRMRVTAVELHTGRYADALGDQAKTELERIVDAARYAALCGLKVNAGHGLNRANVRAITKVKEISELNIGHAIIADAIFMGLAGAVAAMKQMIADGHG